MNYLAHFELAGDHEYLLVGALLGDFVKGPIQNHCYPDAIKTGIILHRKIDAFSDSLPSLSALGQRMPGQTRRYRGIIVDLFFDYMLVRHWSTFRREPVEKYSARIASLLARNSRYLDQEARKLVTRMNEHNFLYRYGERDVIEAVTRRIGVRLRREKELEQAQEHAWNNIEEWEEAFHCCYPEIRDFSREVQLAKGINPSLPLHNKSSK